MAIGQIDSSRLITHGYFVSPVDHKMKLAGSFGELRSNHFHAGIDIKSNSGREGDTIRVAAAGFISRIKIQRGSYGKAIYVDHPNGYTTVYAHMQRFAPQLEDYIREQQRKAESYELDVYPSAEKLIFRQGEYLGHLGNTGRSYGPHLHFEIRETRSETPQNPYLHGIGPTDKKNPMLYSVAAQGLDQDLFEIWNSTKYINNTKPGQYGPEHTFEVPAWRAGMAIQAFDLMDGADNKNGLYHLKMFVDDSLHFEMKIDSVGWDETKYINSFIEYKEKKQNTRTLIRCYKQRANPLSVYRKMKNNGFFKIYAERARVVRFEATDFHGNTSTYQCKVLRRDPNEKDDRSMSYSKKIVFDVDYDLRMGANRFSIPKGATDNILLLDYKETAAGGQAFQIGAAHQPIFKQIKVSSPINGTPLELRSKLVLVNTEGNTATSYGGEIQGDTLTAHVDKLGNYAIIVDTIPPTIAPLEYKKSAAERADFKFRLKDNLDTRGAAKDVIYSVHIDGKWIISELKALGDVLTVPLDEVGTGEHRIMIRATDHSGNSKLWQSTFVR